VKRLLAMGAAALVLAFVVSDQASAQRRGGFGGFSGVRSGSGFSGMRVGGAGFSGMRVGAAGFRGFSGSAIRGTGVGYRGVRVATGARGVGYGVRTAGIRTAAIGPGRPGWGVAGRPGWGGVRPGWRRGWGGWGWGFPLAAAAIGAGYYGSYSSDCWAWDGYQWVNVCYDPYYYGYGY
jgi:hypothetical protein